MSSFSNGCCLWSSLKILFTVWSWDSFSYQFPGLWSSNLITLRMIIIVSVSNICPFSGLPLGGFTVETRSGGTNVSSNWVIPRAPVLHICFSRICGSRVGRGRISRVSRSSWILASGHSPEVTRASWPIWDRGLAHCSSPEPSSLGNENPESPGLIYPGCSQLTPPGDSSDFSSCYLHKGKDHHLFSPPTSSFSVTSTTWNC